jgi:hypothetical protein
VHSLICQSLKVWYVWKWVGIATIFYLVSSKWQSMLVPKVFNDVNILLDVTKQRNVSLDFSQKKNPRHEEGGGYLISWILLGFPNQNWLKKNKEIVYVGLVNLSL